ncbi:MAG: hypothetical protein V4648_06160 [Bacteroidota bacterium]
MKFLSFFKQASPIILLLICVVIGIIAKLIEGYFPSIAMGLQTITFILFVYTFIKFFDSKFK